MLRKFSLQGALDHAIPSLQWYLEEEASGCYSCDSMMAMGLNWVRLLNTTCSPVPFKPPPLRTTGDRLWGDSRA
jgi:hypothetical protein